MGPAGLETTPLATAMDAGPSGGASMASQYRFEPPRCSHMTGSALATQLGNRERAVDRPQAGAFFRQGQMSTLTADVKLDPAAPLASTSRYHAWKCQIWVAVAWT